MKNIIRNSKKCQTGESHLRFSPFNPAPSSRNPINNIFTKAFLQRRYTDSKQCPVAEEEGRSPPPTQSSVAHLDATNLQVGVGGCRALHIAFVRFLRVVLQMTVSPPVKPPTRPSNRHSPLLSSSLSPPLSLSLFSRDVCIMLEQTAKIYRDRGRAINPTN